MVALSIAAKDSSALRPYPCACKPESVRCANHGNSASASAAATRRPHPPRQLGVRIRRLRQARNRTRAWLTAQIDVHVNTISRWERDGISPEPRIAIALDGL